MRRRLSGLRALALGCLIVGALGAGVGSASAFQTHVFLERFGPDGMSGTHFKLPGSVGVDRQSGAIYVGQPFFGNDVEKFNVAHEPEAFTGIDPAIVEGKLTGFGNPGLLSQIAVGPVNHSLYFNTSSSLVAYAPDGEPTDFTAGPNAGTNEIPAPEICGIATDSVGDIYVTEWSTGVRVFSPSGEPLANIAASQVCNLAVDPHGVVYLTEAPNPSFSEDAGQVQRFAPSNEPPVTSSTTYESTGVLDETPSFTVAVDSATGNLLVDEGSQIAEYDESGVRVGSFGVGLLPHPGTEGVGVAVNPTTGSVYVGQGNYESQVAVFGPSVLAPDVVTEAASNIDPKGSATLNGRVKPDGLALTQCAFEYVEEESYRPEESDPYAAGSTVSCVPAAGEIPTAGETAVSAEIRGLVAGRTYHFRLKAANANSPNYGADETVRMPPLPAIEAAVADNLGESSAELSAKVDPGTLRTAYHFEYDTTAYEPGEPEGSHGTSVGAGELAANAGNVVVGPVTVAIAPNTTYHWRVVATNEAGTTLGVDHTFVYDTSGETLPDNRAYEMVTPVHKDGALIGSEGVGVLPAIAANGSSLVLTSIQCFANAQSCAVKQPFGEPFLFSRSSSGWSANALSPPGDFEENTELLPGAEAGAALFSLPTPPSEEQDIYLSNGLGSFTDIGPLTPPAGGAVSNPLTHHPLATSNFSHILFGGNAHFWPPYEGGAAPYEYVGSGNSAPTPVGVSGGRGSTDLLSSCGEELLDGPGTLSEDGEIVYFGADACNAGGTGANAGDPLPVNEIFERVAGGRTAAISEPQALSSGRRSDCTTSECEENTANPTPPAVNPNWREAKFVGASADGSRVFFLSEQQLTDGASQANGLNLYESECGGCVGLTAAEEDSRRRWFDVSEAEGTPVTGGTGLQGLVAISFDGSHVYFIATSVLTEKTNRTGEKAKQGVDNLYVFEQGAVGARGHLAFVTQLPSADQALWQDESESERGTANVTPNGRYLVFESHGKLTSDDDSSDGGAQIFRYDAVTGELVRISVGQRGFNDNGNTGIGDAKIRPASNDWEQAGPFRSDPIMSDDGSYVFFESPIALTPHALNDVQVGLIERPYYESVEILYAENIYEWHEGQVHLISDGRDTSLFGGVYSAVHLVGSDSSGANVFFTTADQLVEADTDTAIDYYDARICTAQEPCVKQAQPLPLCAGEACHGTPATTPPPPSAPTATFDGAGNLVAEPGHPNTSTTKKVKSKSKSKKRTGAKPCRRGKGKAHGRCVHKSIKKKRAGKRRQRGTGR